MTEETFRRIRGALTRPGAAKLGLLMLLALATAVVAHARSWSQSVGDSAATDPVRFVPPIEAKRPRIEAVFVLDTTGSMSGLIEGAKQKIWTLASEMANARSQPEIRIGLVAYRDRGDDYVTRRFDLSPDLDAMYAELMRFSAGGGGDGPESVNQALHEALNQMAWTTDAGVYRVVFLVGDAPPHMDYEQDVPYTETVALAAKRGIVVNAIQCGQDVNTASVWKRIAGLAQGEYAAIAQDGAMVAMTTPVDGELAALNTELAGTALTWGAEADRTELKDKVARSLEAPAPAAASRLSYLAKAGGKLNSGRSDLVDAIERGEADLDRIAEAELPEELRGLARSEQEGVIAERAERRKSIQARISELVKERDAYLVAEREHRKAEGAADGFDDKVIGAVKEQAASVGIHY
ncbi:MAG: VWA domain-containing protein [Myxococcota bacterium]